MDRRTLSEYLLIILMVLSDALRVLAQENGRNRMQRRNGSEGTIKFQVSNETGHQLPVFDPVVKYVGRSAPIAPIAPQADVFGNPLCVNNTDDTFCVAVDSYPDAEIRRAIKYSPDEFRELFGTQTIVSRTLPRDMSDETVCPQKSRLFYPKAAVNENERWAFVVNDVDYVQAVMSEMCENEDKPCTYLDGALPSGITSHCRQKYAYKRLLALHPDKKKTYTDAFKFPSCCVCYVKRPFILTRTRMLNEENKRQGQ